MARLLSSNLPGNITYQGTETMNTNDLQTRVAKLEKSVLELRNINVRLMNQEAVMRCMMHTLLAQMPDDKRREMAAAYGMLLTSAIEQIPPRLQDREILQEFDEILSPRT